MVKRQPVYFAIALAMILVGVAVLIQGLDGYVTVVSTKCLPDAMLCPHLDGTPDLITAGLGGLVVILGVALLTEFPRQTVKLGREDEQLVRMN
ncbi:MAG: hypothetical protein M1587_10295 [Thaumarchaeota archaeon]|nr:hypothetical protein [Nitrososphaerota archaeon]